MCSSISVMMNDAVGKVTGIGLTVPEVRLKDRLAGVVASARGA
jgi:hypothetical protein